MVPPAPEPLASHMRRRPGMYIGGDAFGVRGIIDDIVTGQLDAPGARPRHVRCSIGAAEGSYTIEVCGHGFGGKSGVWRCEARDAHGVTAEAVCVHLAGGEAGIVHSFVNGRRTLGGGTHVNTLREAAAEAIARFPDNPPKPFRNFGNADPLAGLMVLLAVRLDDPRYAGSIRLELDDERVVDVIRRMLASTIAPAAENADE